MIYIDVDTAVTVPVNIMPLMDDSDFITREVAITYNHGGMDLVWNFIISAGVITQTVVTPTTAGVYDWTHIGDGMYKIEIPASGGGSINNDAEGVGYFTGICTGVLAWRGPDIVFRAAALNDALIDGGDSLDVNVTAVSGDTTAADNLELDYDGTGYVKANSTIGTTTTNTDMVAAAPTAANIRTEIDSNSTQLAAIVADTNELQTDDIPTTLATLATSASIAALNNVAATDIVSAGPITTSSGAVSSVTTVGTTTTNTDMRGTDNAALASALATVDTNVDAILVDTGTTIPTSISALNNVAATDIVSAGAITTLSGAVVNVDLVDVCTTNTDMRGTDGANTTVPDNAGIAAVQAKTDNLPTDPADQSLVIAATDAIVSAVATVDSNVDAILVDTGTTLPAQITALNNVSVSDVLTTQMTEAYAADGAAPTLAESLFLIQQVLTEFGIVGTTLTAKKLDGSTSAATFTLDDADTPTSLTRAS